MHATTERTPDTRAVIHTLAELARRSRVTAIRDVCEAFDELLFEDDGDALAMLAPWLAAQGITEEEVTHG